MGGLAIRVIKQLGVEDIGKKLESKREEIERKQTTPQKKRV